MEQVFPEPTWGIPQDADPESSAFCKLQVSPFLLTGIFLRLLQYQFSDPNNIDNPKLKSGIWTTNSECEPRQEVITDPETGNPVTITIQPSRIWIDVEYSESASDTNRRPAIFVKRESFRTDPVALRNEMHTGIDACEKTLRGQKMLIPVVGSHSLVCTGLTGAEADALGEEVYFRMLQYMSVIRDDFNLGSLQIREASDVKTQDLGGGRKSFYTVVAVTWSYMYQWTVIKISPVLRRLLLSYANARSC